MAVKIFMTKTIKTARFKRLTNRSNMIKAVIMLDLIMKGQPLNLVVLIFCHEGLYYSSQRISD